LINVDPTAINVRADDPYGTLADLMQAIRAAPGKLQASGTAQGGIWHLSLSGLLAEQGLPPDAVVWVPSTGSAAGLQDLISGGVHMVPGSLAEARSLIDAGRVKALAVLDDARSTLYPDVPTGVEAIGTKWQMGVWRGIGAPRHLPPAVQARLETALKAAYDSAEFREFMANRGFGMRWAGPAEFATFMADSDAQMGEAMKRLGLARE
jgi:tripartite-type tricarboxylate transporter receptor subunit TctC